MHDLVFCDVGTCFLWSAFSETVSSGKGVVEGALVKSDECVSFSKNQTCNQQQNQKSCKVMQLCHGGNRNDIHQIYEAVQGVCTGFFIFSSS